MVSIRPATEDDALVIHAIQMRAFAREGQLGGNLQIPPLAETADEVVAHIRTQTVLVAETDRRIVGSARGLRDGATCSVHRVSVEPSYHGRGIGAALLRSLEAAHPEVERFALTTNTGVPGNVAFYERRGYRVTELTPYGDTIVLAQMSKDVRAKDSATTAPQP